MNNFFGAKEEKPAGPDPLFAGMCSSKQGAHDVSIMSDELCVVPDCTVVMVMVSILEELLQSYGTNVIFPVMAKAW